VQCSAVQCSAVQCSTVQYSTVQYSTVQYSTVQYSTVQYSTVQYSTVQYSTVQYSTVQYSTVQYSTVQYSTVQYMLMSRRPAAISILQTAPPVGPSIASAARRSSVIKSYPLSSHLGRSNILSPAALTARDGGRPTSSSNTKKLAPPTASVQPKTKYTRYQIFQKGFHIDIRLQQSWPTMRRGLVF
jgi:hypothetical protein